MESAIKALCTAGHPDRKKEVFKLATKSNIWPLGWPLFFDFKIIMLSPPHFTLLYEKLRETNF